MKVSVNFNPQPLYLRRNISWYTSKRSRVFDSRWRHWNFSLT